MVVVARVPEDPELVENRQTASLAALALLLALIVTSLFLVDHLRRESQRQDCLLAGRTACEPPD